MKDYAQKDLSTKKITPPEEARLPGPRCDQNRKKSPQVQKIEGPLAPDRLKSSSSNPTPQANGSPQLMGNSAGPGQMHAHIRWGGKRRIRSRKEFNDIYTHGKNFSNSLVVFKCLPNERAYSRAAFSVGKKLGKATRRNRVKRLMREALRSLEVKPGWDLLFISRPAMMGASFSQVRDSLEKALERAGILLKGNPDS